MTIILGNSLSDGKTLPPAPDRRADHRCMSPADLLAYLEGFYALGAPPVNREALRTEQYRQLLIAHLAQREAHAEPLPFYHASFVADQTATATELLSRRDELITAGYALRADPSAATPARLVVLHQLEALLLDDRYDFRLLPGPADRLNALLAALPDNRHPRLEVWLNEPRDLLRPGPRRLLVALEATGSQLRQLPEPAVLTDDSDLARWQAALRSTTATTATTSLKGDGSLVLLRAQRETHIAAYLARLLRRNPDWRPGVMLTVPNQTLDNALLSEGLPSLGVPSTSLARPSLQVLKLITTFLWQPLEVDRVMEFVSLVTKPLHWRLGQRIAVFLADTPGLFGPRWFQMLEGFFREMEQDRNWPPTRLAAVREQYETWFRRKRYDRDGKVPKFDLRQLLNSLREWALEEYAESKKKEKDQPLKREHTGLLVLAAQAMRAMELLDAQPETELSYLEVERLVRTVYEPAPTQFQQREVGALATIFAPASALQLPDGEAVPKLIWWDFIEHEPDYFFSRYYPDELAYLDGLGVEVFGPAQQNALSAWTQLRPVLHAREQLVLCLPARTDGSAVEAHPLFGDLEAAFPPGALAAITVDVDAGGAARGTLVGKVTATFSPVAVRPLARPVAQLKIGRANAIKAREPETPTGLEDLLYYPHKWVFRHQLKLKGTPILSIAGDNRLRGNLSHLFIERLLTQIKKDARPYTRDQVAAWVDANWRRLLENEGAVLLEYGQEPERVRFVRTMHYAAWSLVHHIQENGWAIRGSEALVEGKLRDQQVKGRADLVLERTRDGRQELAIVDLKWRGKSTFRNLLRNAKDVQLCLYAEFVGQVETAASPRVHTAYYVLRDALMIARNELAFANIETVSSADEAEVVQRDTLTKITATYNWRWSQFREGTVEVRCHETLGELEDLYLDLDHDALLELGEEDARFDDYRSLIGLVR